MSERYTVAFGASLPRDERGRPIQPASPSDPLRAALERIRDYEPSYNAIDDRAEMRRIARAALAAAPAETDRPAASGPGLLRREVAEAVGEVMREVRAGSHEPEGLALLREVAAAGIVIDIPGKYVEVQIDHRTWEQVAAYVTSQEASRE